VAARDIVVFSPGEARSHARDSHEPLIIRAQFRATANVHWCTDSRAKIRTAECEEAASLRTGIPISSRFLGPALTSLPYSFARLPPHRGIDIGRV
jgi:hypothetical protein